MDPLSKFLNVSQITGGEITLFFSIRIISEFGVTELNLDRKGRKD